MVKPEFAVLSLIRYIRKNCEFTTDFYKDLMTGMIIRHYINADEKMSATIDIIEGMYYICDLWHNGMDDFYRMQHTITDEFGYRPSGLGRSYRDIRNTNAFFYKLDHYIENDYNDHCR